MPLNQLSDSTASRYARGTRAWALAFSNWSINTKASNIPLLVSYADWFFSTEGGDTASYGEEGVAFVVNEKGERLLSDMILNDTSGGWLNNLYAGDPFSDVGLMDQMRSYAVEGGQRYVDMMRSWVVPNYLFKGGDDWPSSNAKGTDEQQREISSFATDTAMYIGENFLQFVDGTKPMSDWTGYISGLNSTTQIGRRKLIWQAIYDNFISENPEYAQK
jgi:hypothetical protein